MVKRTHFNVRFILHFLSFKTISTLIFTHSWVCYIDCVSFIFKVADFHEVIENDNFLFSSLFSCTHISQVQSAETPHTTGAHLRVATYMEIHTRHAISSENDRLKIPIVVLRVIIFYNLITFIRKATRNILPKFAGPSASKLDGWSPALRRNTVFPSTG